MWPERSEIERGEIGGDFLCKFCNGRWRLDSGRYVARGLYSVNRKTVFRIPMCFQFSF